MSDSWCSWGPAPASAVLKWSHFKWLRQRVQGDREKYPGSLLSHLKAFILMVIRSHQKSLGGGVTWSHMGFRKLTLTAVGGRGPREKTWRLESRQERFHTPGRGESFLSSWPPQMMSSTDGVSRKDLEIQPAMKPLPSECHNDHSSCDFVSTTEPSLVSLEHGISSTVLFWADHWASQMGPNHPLGQLALQLFLFPMKTPKLREVIRQTQGSTAGRGIDGIWTHIYLPSRSFICILCNLTHKFWEYQNQDVLKQSSNPTPSLSRDREGKGLLRNISSERGLYSESLDPQPSPVPIHLAPAQNLNCVLVVKTIPSAPNFSAVCLGSNPTSKGRGNCTYTYIYKDVYMCIYICLFHLFTVYFWESHLTSLS